MKVSVKILSAYVYQVARVPALTSQKCCLERDRCEICQHHSMGGTSICVVLHYEALQEKKGKAKYIMRLEALKRIIDVPMVRPCPC